MLASLCILIVSRSGRLERSGFDPRHYAFPGTLRHKATVLVLPIGTHDSFGLPLPPARRANQLVIVAPSFVRKHAGRIAE